MKNLLTTFALVLLAGCGLLPPKTVPVEENLASSARICGQSSEVFAILFHDRIVANAIAVDQRLAPEFEQEKKNLIGATAVQNPLAYCSVVADGKHEITLLAERESGIGITGGISYYVGECSFVLEPDIEYYTVPKRSGEWLSDLVVVLKSDDQEISAGDCEMTPISRDGVLSLLEKLRVR